MNKREILGAMAFRTHRPIFFHSFLDELCADLVGHDLPKVSPKGLIADPASLVLPAGRRPKGVPRYGDMLEGEKLLWVRDAGTGLRWPYWLRGHYLDIISYLRERGHSPEEIGLGYDQRRLITLLRSGALVSDHGKSARADSWKKTEAKAKASLASNGYALLPDLIHPFLNHSLAHYYRCMLAEGHFPFDDGQVALRYYGREEGMAAFIHRQLAPVIARLVGKRVWPTYAYFSSYQGGAVLEKHLDRPTAEISLSVAVDYTPTMDRKNAWPLIVESGGKKVQLRLAPGDGGVFYGTRHYHYRKKLAEGSSASVILMHYATKPLKTVKY